MLRKHHKYRIKPKSESVNAPWGESSGHRRWSITTLNLQRYKRKSVVLSNMSIEAEGFSDLFEPSVRQVARTRTEYCSSYAWRIVVEGRGMMDDFGALKSSVFTEWRCGSDLLPFTDGTDAAGWRRLRSWGLRNLPDWRSCWDRSWMKSTCVGDFAYWVARVVSSRWWVDRVGYQKEYILAPIGLPNPPGGWELSGGTARVFRSTDSLCLYVSREQCTGWDMMLHLLTYGRKKNSLPSFKALYAFTARFWGVESAEDLRRELRKVFPKALSR